MKIFNLPDLGEGLAEAEIVRWHVKPGDRINADDPMLAVETAKAIVEVPAPFSGVIKTLHGAPGDTVATGGLLVEFEPDPLVADAGTVVGSMPIDNDDFAFGPNSVVSANTTSADRIRAIPAARALAKRLGIDITRVRGSGRGGLITVDDVLQMTPAPTPQRNTTDSESERLRGPRRAMAQSMAISRDNVMDCTLFDDAEYFGRCIRVGARCGRRKTWRTLNRQIELHGRQ